MRRGAFITVDVECSMGGAWWNPSLRAVPPSRAILGQYGGRELGLPLIVEILRNHGLAATFFLEALVQEQGYGDQMESVCHFLLDAGQDVQLHLHPIRRMYWLRQQRLPHSYTDAMADLEPAQQLDLLGEGARRIQEWTGRLPVAFRAGNMSASEQTLAQLPAAGLRIDSSYTFPYAGGQCRFAPKEPYNGSRWYGDVLELALSGFYVPRIPGLSGAKPADLMGVSAGEIREVIEKTVRADADAVVILHSFSLLKVRNVQYDGGRPNRIVIRRLRQLCQWLERNRDLAPCHTFAELGESLARKDYQANSVAPCRAGGLRSLARKAVQAYNHWYWT